MMKRYRKLKLFPHRLYIAQCSCHASHLVLGPGGTAALSAPPGFLHARAGPGVLRLAGLWLPLVCTTSPWCLGNTSSMALSVLSGWGGRDVSFRLLWEFLFQNKVGFPPLIERGSFQNKKVSKPCVHLCR